MQNSDKKPNELRQPVLNKANVSRRLDDVLVKVDGELIPIRELPKDEYEQFLDIMHKLRLAYISAVGRPNGG